MKSKLEINRRNRIEYVIFILLSFVLYTQDSYSQNKSNEDFIPSSEFIHSKPGYVFYMGPKGLGYYVDKQDNSFNKNNKKAPNLNFQESNEDFIPSSEFIHSKPGYVFYMGPKGLGYYVDKQGMSSNENLIPTENELMTTIAEQETCPLQSYSHLSQQVELLTMDNMRSQALLNDYISQSVTNPDRDSPPPPYSEN